MIKKFKNITKESDKIYLTQKIEGYWSNLSKDTNLDLISKLETKSSKKCIEEINPMLLDVIYSEKRVAALELLQLNGKESVVDLGCMWGALSIPTAKQVEYVLGIDQTLESLKFTEFRAKEENLENIELLCGNLREIILPENSFDVAIVNGVLEWIPETETIVVEDYIKKNNKRFSEGNPKIMQMNFLKNIHNGLKNKGRIFLAIENRYDYKMFFGQKDPHSGLHFTTISPRWLANAISKVFKNREYRPWIYSFQEIQELLNKANFKNIHLFSCWPDYRFPEYINTYGVYNEYFKPIDIRNDKGDKSLKRMIANRIEWLLFKKFNFQFFAPSIIAIAEK